MARPAVADRKPIQANAADHVDAYSIDEFCARHRISPQLFYKLKPQGLMPLTFSVGTRVLISREAADAWRRARENAAQQPPVRFCDDLARAPSFPQSKNRKTT
ncbi:hypothetical protein [Bradyrhizobium sp. McL0616]|uniref:hypothetical protein n=1 Tax=Bradyrhizobium sp. McL0616 TaxID=3415674 RepID=UPI003CF9A534